MEERVPDLIPRFEDARRNCGRASHGSTDGMDVIAAAEVVLWTGGVLLLISMVNCRFFLDLKRLLWIPAVPRLTEPSPLYSFRGLLPSFRV